ncbi:class I SAM-dependent methyltransferase [Alkalihalobacterium elongatum]|uniref:class I SAM-dependent methyltransferase n=1 Tax=Alkalihalobacterium elongatum TaxID=2675466 RepID=UPI001C1FBF3C|nr:methyltransferase domain-containing protein [Alkalihalobacterium elongatum]
MSQKMRIQLIGTAKQTVRSLRSSEIRVVKLGVSIIESMWKVFYTTKRFISDPIFRSIFSMQLLNSRNVHQTTPLTGMNRYPEIFSACKNYLKDKHDLKILSYGCSTGEEVLTLRNYFPTAQISGADVNKRSLKICRSLSTDNKISFIFSTPRNLKKQGPYDAIFCMAVLQRTPHDIANNNITSLKTIYPFEKFEKQIIELDQLVKPNGLLIVHYTQFSLFDTKVGYKYRALGNITQHDYVSPVFDQESIIVNNNQPLNTIFIKSNGI